MIKRSVFTAAIAVAAAAFAPTAHAATITVINSCNQTIWPAIYIQNYASSLPYNGGWSMAANTQVSFSVPNNSNAARLWARKSCNTGTSPYQCATGACGGSGAQCDGTTGAQGTSLFEFTLVPGGQDTWDVSYVDGYDFPIGVTWNGNGSACSYSGSNAPANPTCHTDILSGCPSSFQDIVNGADVECKSPCTATGNTQYCCSAAPYNEGPTQCAESSWPSVDQSYVNLVHTDCPGSYGYAYDDINSTWNCPNGTNYTVQFCPNGIQPGSTGGTTGGGTTGGSGNPPSNGVHTLTPGCATGSRLDDYAAATTNGNKIDIYTANGTAAQNWNFALLSGTSNHWNLATLGPYCLSSGTSASGSAYQLWSCNGASNETFVTGSAAQSGAYNFAALGYNECMTVTGGGSANYTVIENSPCNGSTSQAWYIN